MVRVSVPCTGCARRMIPPPPANTAEISDHQKPGICRAQNVRTRPATPLIRNIQPRKMVTARLASGGAIIAGGPRDDHGGEAEDRQKDAFDQESLPVRAHRRAHSGLKG